MADSKLASPNAKAMSPLHECAICLETCTNKCHSDSCRHQFCYKCLLCWSEIKEECPVCKRAFKSIIHDNEYDDEYVENLTVEDNRLFENALVYLPRIAINETAASDHDSDVIVVNDANQPSEPIINVVDTDSDESFPLSQMVCKAGPRSQKPQMVSKFWPGDGGNQKTISTSKLGDKNEHTRWKTRAKKRPRHVTSLSCSSSSTSESESTESDVDCNQEDQSADPIINVVDTDSDESFPQSQTVSKVGPRSQMLYKVGPRTQMLYHVRPGEERSCSIKNPRHVTSSSSSSSSTSYSQSESTKSDCNGMHQQRKRFKKKVER